MQEEVPTGEVAGRCSWPWGDTLGPWSSTYSAWWFEEASTTDIAAQHPCLVLLDILVSVDRSICIAYIHLVFTSNCYIIFYNLVCCILISVPHRMDIYYKQKRSSYGRAWEMILRSGISRSKIIHLITFTEFFKNTFYNGCNRLHSR